MDSGYGQAPGTAETDERVGNAAGRLVDQKMVDFANLVGARTINERTFNIHAGDQLVVRMHCCFCRAKTPLGEPVLTTELLAAFRCRIESRPQRERARSSRVA